LSALVAIDWALAGTETFTHELAPPAPFMVVFGVAFTIEPRPAPPPPPPEATAPPPPAPRGRVRGRVVAVGTGAAVADVAVRISGSETSAWLSDGSGHFTTEPLAPGEHTLSLTHATAEPGRCTVRVPDAGGDVEARCELVSRPPRSTVALHVVDAFGVPVSGALVVCSGPTQVTVTADPQGRVARDDLAPGAYQVRVEARGYLLHVSDLVLGSTKVEQAIVLLPRPSAAGVQVRGKRIVVPALRFEEDATSLGPEARLVAAELADLLLRTPEIARVRVTAGGEAGPAPLARAHAVREALLAAGVPEGRIEAAAGAGASGGVDVAIVE
jgi:outer membrane protein OmpA-like peptidoglycan-associated protein